MQPEQIKHKWNEGQSKKKKLEEREETSTVERQKCPVVETKVGEEEKNGMWFECHKHV